jgi:hypothetical protein
MGERRVSKLEQANIPHAADNVRHEIESGDKTPLTFVEPVHRLQGNSVEPAAESLEKRGERGSHTLTPRGAITSLRCERAARFARAVTN